MQVVTERSGQASQGVKLKFKCANVLVLSTVCSDISKVNNIEVTCLQTIRSEMNIRIYVSNIDNSLLHAIVAALKDCI